MKSLLILFALLTSIVWSHDMMQMKGDMTILDDGWKAQIDIECWALYPEDGPHLPDETVTKNFAGTEWMSQLAPAELTQMKQTANEYLTDCFRLSLDGKPLTHDIAFPDFAVANPVWKTTDKGTAVYQIELQGKWPPATSGPLELLWLDYSGEPMALQLHTHDASGKEQLSVLRVVVKEPILLTHISNSGQASATASTSLWAWIVAGFEHIIPKGLDHILFILGLFLLQPKVRALLTQSMAFTIAHSITLGMVVAGVFSISSAIVEPAIALSIAYVGFENIWVKELKPWRIGLIFALGLLHGMGFASVMKELDIPSGSIFTPLLGFNLGVEFGQLAVLTGAFILTWYFLKKPVFRQLRFLGSLLIGLTGLYWTVERIIG